MKPTNIFCKECIIAKQQKVSFSSNKFTKKEKLEIIHTDLSGPTRTRGFYGERYFTIFVDDFTRMVWVAFLKEKYVEFEKFKVFKNRSEDEYGVKIKCLRYNRRGEFTSRELNIFCEENDIKRQLSTPKTPNKNVIVERRNRSISEEVRVIIFENDVSMTFQRERVNTIVYTINKVQIKKAQTKILMNYGLDMQHQ